MAFSKKQKNAMLAQYEEWLDGSQAVFMLSYSRMGMKDIDALRARIRDAGGQGHVVKNTLMEIALRNHGVNVDQLTGTTLMGFAFSDVPGLAKVFADAAKSDVFELSGGIMDKQMLTASQVKSLADLPPLPVMRARLLGTILAPASQLVRTLAEPARQVAAVVKAYSEQAGQAA